MKRIFFLFIAILATTATFAQRAYYLDVTQHWCCKNTYYIYFSGDRTGQPAGSYRMDPVDGKDGIYVYYAVNDTQDNVRFCFSNSESMAYVNKQVGTHTGDVKGWSSAKPYYVIDSDKGNDNADGHWAAEAGEAATIAIENAEAELLYNCVSGMYEAKVSILLNGVPCGMKLSGTLIDETITTPASPYEFNIPDIDIAEGATTSVTIAIYSDIACSQLIEQRELVMKAPQAKCEKVHEVHACIGETVRLKATMSGDMYYWSGGEDTRSIQFVADTEGTTDFTVWSCRTVITPERNLMANGGFENNPPTFHSDYLYAGWNLTNYYEQPGHYSSNLYAITNNTHNFWKDYAVVKPHSGNWFALFDAGKKGFAWYALTSENPELQLIKDTTYHFSYWAAHPNIPQYSGSPAQLQFVIKYTDENNVNHQENLGEPYTLPNTDNEWHQQLINWKAPCNSANVLIGVYDLNNNDGDGNDFCLDDIMFQTVSKSSSEIVFTDRFSVTIEDCECDGPVIYRKWNDFLFVDNSDSLYVAYQWYHNSVAIDGANGQYYRITNEDGSHTPSGVYTVEVTTHDGTKALSCEKTFKEATPSAPIYPAGTDKAPVATRIYPVGDHMQIEVTIYDDDTIESKKHIIF